jgi:hypothetical protein
MTGHVPGVKKHPAEDRTYSLEASDRGVTVQDNGSIFTRKKEAIQ